MKHFSEYLKTLAPMQWLIFVITLALTIYGFINSQDIGVKVILVLMFIAAIEVLNNQNSNVEIEYDQNYEEEEKVPDYPVAAYTLSIISKITGLAYYASPPMTDQCILRNFGIRIISKYGETVHDNNKWAKNYPQDNRPTIDFDVFELRVEIVSTDWADIFMLPDDPWKVDELVESIAQDMLNLATGRIYNSVDARSIRNLQDYQETVNRLVIEKNALHDANKKLAEEVKVLTETNNILVGTDPELL